MNEQDQKAISLIALDAEAYKKFFRKLEKTKPRTLDRLFHERHEAEFEKMDCLSCANCCKTTSPIFRDVDIERLAKHMRMKALDFVKSYLQVDEDGDYVLREAPCAFLEEDNSCSVYSVRPQACRQYPHTDRKNMFQILKITSENALICPAVARITQQIKVHVDS